MSAGDEAAAVSDVEGADEEERVSDEAAESASPSAIGSAGSKSGARRRRRSGGRGPACRGLRVNTVACTGKSAKDLFAVTAEQLGWREVDVEARPSAGSPRPSALKTIYCVMQTSDMVERLPLRASSWATRYAAMPELCDKGNLARMIASFQDLVGEGTFAFSPRTWVLPEQLEELKAVVGKSSKTFIVKPEDGSQGDGIFLVQGVRDLDIKLSCNANKSGVAQRYLDKPLLHRGFKFDFRVYVAFIGGSESAPPFVYLCREGLARFCTELYEEPSQKNMHKCMGHLTNYSLNKRSEQFEHSGETVDAVFSKSTQSSKRPLTVALQQIAEERPDFRPEEFYGKVTDCVRSTAALMAPVLQAAGRELHTGGELRSCQVLGFDVMLDHRGEPYLLEVNNSPSLCIDEALPLDEAELAEAAAKKGPRAKTAAGDAVCRCMDMQQPHRHRTSLVDLVVKRTVMAGLFRMLEGLGEEPDVAPSDEDYIEVDLRGDEVFELLASVEKLFRRAGGAKAFTSAGLRRVLGPLCCKGALEKHDLDAMALRLRASRFQGDQAMRLFDYVQVLREVSAKAFPGMPPGEAIRKALEAT